MVRVGIAGATGYAGAELVRILADHPQVEITSLTSRQNAGIHFGRVFPAMRDRVDLVCEKMDIDALCEKTDVLFTALPHKIPMEIVPEFVKRGKKVVDLSADFRFKDILKYEAFYQPHTAKHILDEAVYGLSEIYGEDIRKASVVGNPGCYPTSALLPLLPFIRQEWVDTRQIIIDSKSGVSGAGRSISLATHFCEVNESFKAYKVGVHRHTPEIEEVLGRQAGQPIQVTFVPHLVPMTRGMLTTTYVNLLGTVSESDILECLNAAYAGKPFIRIYTDNHIPDTLYVRGTNYCDIGFKLEERNRRLILISAIDNLGKGAAGQAVQNMNLMLGYDEAMGLMRTPYPV